ncbi:MAG: aminotransferase class V-fold PLP-dependent enzyme, partial [Cyanobacteria bacterium REEB65]|nr:aminotransferase class V-fold PLP-dependent enzyme [Cyanobacteria bacterium REEB65]
KPEAVHQAMDAFSRQQAGNPGRGSHAMAVGAARAVSETRARLARLIGAESPSQIAFALNATDALNMAIHGVLRPGDHVVTTMLEHNSVMRPLHGLAKRGVITLDCVRCGPSAILDPEDIQRHWRPNTRLIAMTHCSNVTGTIQPIEAVARIARERGILLLVDAAQSAGVLPLDVKGLGVDLLAAPGHKGLLGPMGTGFLYVRSGLELEHWRLGGTGTRSEDLEHPGEMPERLEAGTLNALGLAGLGAGIQFLQANGSALEHERYLAARFVAGLAEVRGATVFGDMDPQKRVGTVSFTITDVDPIDLAAILDQHFQIAARSGLHCAPCAHKTIGTLPHGTVRFSFGRFNTIDQVEAALGAIEEIATT